MRKFGLIFCCLLMTACGGSLNHQLTDFRAYYNTFYNAQKDFRAGHEKVEQQPVTLEPDHLTRAHPRRALAGRDDFEEAIKNGAEILRRFPRSKWTDDALLLIGKSYYFLQEDFLAIQKFEELIDLPSESKLKQEAVIWKGRTLLDIESYSRGVQFLQSSLSDFEGRWNPQYKAETEVVLAEHFSRLSQWQKAEKTLEPALKTLNGGALKGRGYLLLGQLLQRRGAYERAFQAFSRVRSNHPAYEYTFRADLERARSKKLAGNAKEAAEIFAAMLKDDKNFRRRNEILFQLAGIYHDAGRYRDAEDIYKRILANTGGDDPADIKTESYFRLGQIYSRQYHDFGVAAAYFDSSSTQRSTNRAAEKENGAGKLASAYGRYISIKQDISRVDSLLTLGALDDQALQKRLIVIRGQRRQELEQSQNAVQQTNNTLANASRSPEPSPSATESNSTGQFGFLNYHNREMVRRGHQKFIAVWGKRPLVDNWRRKEVLQSTTFGDTEDSTDQPAREIGPDENTGDKQLGINLNEIPHSSRQKKTLQLKRMNAQYRLGSLFFLTLDQPDSAAFYYKKVLHQPVASPLEAQTMYSLYELYNLHQKPDSAAAYKQRILVQYPQSKFARHLNTDAKDDTSAGQQQDSSRVLRQRVQQILSHQARGDSAQKAAASLKELAVNHQKSPLAPSIYFQAVQMDIDAARRQDSTAGRDSLNAQPADSLEGVTYDGPAWDRARADLQEFTSLFPQSAPYRQAQIWLKLLKNPEALKEMPSCKDLGVAPVIKEGKETFIKSVTLPARVRRMNISGRIRYRFVIGKEGAVKSYKLLSNPTHLGIEEAYEKAFDDHLSFKPIKKDGRSVRASCEVTFPIHQ